MKSENKLVPIKCERCSYPFRTRVTSYSSGYKDCAACRQEDAADMAERRARVARKRAREIRDRQTRRLYRIRAGQIKLREVVIKTHVGWFEISDEQNRFDHTEYRAMLLCGAKGRPATTFHEVDSHDDLVNVSVKKIRDAIASVNCARCLRALRKLLEAAADGT